MSTGFYEKLQHQTCIKDTVTLKTAGKGLKMTAEYTNRVNLTIDNLTFKWNVYVAPISDDLILGLDFMYQHKMQIDLYKGNITLCGKEIPLQKMKQDGGKKFNISKVVLQKRTTVPPEAMLQVVVSLPHVSAAKTYSISPSVLKNGLMIPYTLVKGNNEVVLPITNVSQGFVTLKKGHVVGIAIEAEELDHQEEDILVRNISKEKDTLCDLPRHLIELYERSSSKLETSQLDRFKSLLMEYQEIFSTGDTDIGCFTEIKHKIDTGKGMKEGTTGSNPFHSTVQALSSGKEVYFED
jgi:hypothetical protein